MKQHMYWEDRYAIIPYTRFLIEDPSFFSLLESYEVYDNRVSFQTFADLHMKKWISFGEQAKTVDEITVFECAYLQNHINELLLFHCMAEKDINDYLMKLITTVKDLNPILIYLSQPDVYETINRVSDSRVDEKGEKVWRDRVISYIENSAYGKAHSLEGFDGMVTYFKDRKKIELNIINNLPVETYIINNAEYNWDEVWEEIQKIIIRIIKGE